MDDGMNPAPWQTANQTEYGHRTADRQESETEQVQGNIPPGREDSGEIQGEPRPAGKKKKRRKKRKKSKNYLLRIFIVLAVAAAIVGVLHVDYFTVAEVTVTGNEYMTQEQVLKGTKIKTGRNIFDVHVLWEEHRIKSKKYVDDVDVSRELPDRIIVSVTEKKGMAQFKHGTKYVVTDNDGNALEVVKNPRNITLVNGVSIKSVTAGKKVEASGNADLGKVYKLLAAMDDGDLYFKSVTLENGRVTAYIYDELKVVGSYGNLMDSIKSETLKTVVYDLYQKGKNKGTIKVSGGNYCSFTE